MEINVTFNRFGNKAEGKNKQGNDWNKIEIVCSTIEEYPKTICFATFNKVAAVAANMIANQPYKVQFDVESREYNGKWYTECRAFNIVGQFASDEQTEGDLPF